MIEFNVIAVEAQTVGVDNHMFTLVEQVVVVEEHMVTVEEKDAATGDNLYCD